MFTVMTDTSHFFNSDTVSFGWDELLELLETLAGLPYGGEPVDQRSHALQAARQAQEAEASDEAVLAALLHDVGRATAVRRQFPGLPHETAGARWIEPRLGPAVARLVAAHVPAKRYLVATDPAYASVLSRASVASLRVQGGPMSREETVDFAGTVDVRAACELRRWDDRAKQPSGAEANPQQLRAALERVTQRLTEQLPGGG